MFSSSTVRDDQSADFFEFFSVEERIAARRKRQVGTIRMPGQDPNGIVSKSTDADEFNSDQLQPGELKFAKYNLESAFLYHEKIAKDLQIRYSEAIYKSLAEKLYNELRSKLKNEFVTITQELPVRHDFNHRDSVTLSGHCCICKNEDQIVGRSNDKPVFFSSKRSQLGR